MSKVWLLFDNGNYYTVNCSVYPPKPGNPKPADAFIVSENEGDFTIAARNAAHAAYTCLKSRGEKVSPQIAGIELLERTNTKANIVGESGGLCFAISFAKALLNLDMPDVAATGVINADGTIEKIKGIETKLETAAGLVNENGFIFYPKDNGYTICDDLCLIFRHKQIKCHPVSHIDQVFSILMPGHQKKGTLNKIILLILAISIISASGYYFLTLNGKSPLPAKKEITRPVKETGKPADKTAKAKSIETKQIPLSEKAEDNQPIAVKQAPIKTDPEDNKGFD